MKGKTKQFMVLGMGLFGSSLAKALHDLGHEVLAVDADADLVEAIAPHVTQAVQIDATDEAALQELGVRNFDAVIVSIGKNLRDSILVCV
ncbi:MAG TPA: NAD-binding protein, partial [Candidatus Limiplasma sp.]|nr:NAD-binding protein [Candidatus Limiplasma sp.]